MSNDLFNILQWAVLGLAAVNILLSIALVKLHLGKGRSRMLDWTCSGPFDCRSVLNSRYGLIHFLPPHPVPLAALGLAYYTTLGVWLAVVGRLSAPWHQFWILPALMGLAGIASSVWLLDVMARRLRAWCSFCLVTHVINLLIVAGVWTLWLAGPDPAAARHTWTGPFLALAFGAAASLAEIYYVQTRRIARMLDRTYDKLNHVQTDQFLTTRPVDIPLDDCDPVIVGPPLNLDADGRPSPARHTAVIFSDFACSSCAQMHQVTGLLREHLDSRLRIVHKDFPLNRACNPGRRDSDAPDYEAACYAAAAAEAARRLGGPQAFDRMSHLLFTQQHTLPRHPYEAFARQIGLNVEAFNCLCNDCEVRRQIVKDANLGTSLGVHGTPTVFLDGRLLPNPVIQRGPEVLLNETLDHWEHLLALLDRYTAKAAVQRSRTR